MVTATMMRRYLFVAITLSESLRETFSSLTLGAITSFVFLKTRKNIGVAMTAKMTATIV